MSWGMRHIITTAQHIMPTMQRSVLTMQLHCPDNTMRSPDTARVCPHSTTRCPHKSRTARIIVLRMKHATVNNVHQVKPVGGAASHGEVTHAPKHWAAILQMRRNQIHGAQNGLGVHNARCLESAEQERACVKLIAGQVRAILLLHAVWAQGDAA